MKDMSARSTAAAIGLMFLAVGCRAPHFEAPEVAFKGLEERMLNAQVVQLAFHITAEGAVSADLDGSLELGTGTILLKGNGVFAGNRVDLVLEADDDQVAFGNRPDQKVTDTPPELRAAILIGLTRMGILHNLARLTGGALPDHANGGVREWVVVDSLAVDPRHDSTVSFALTVDGQPSGTATLGLAPSGHPVERHQTVHFTSGEMRVIERYSNVIIE